jgi:anti-sigma regulatory factor (Ser/Thr protein kinase)
MAASLTVDADVARLADVRTFVRRTLAAGGVDSEATADLVQAVDEVVTNVIEHGYAGAGGTIDVEVAVGRSGDPVTVRVRDACPPFDPTTVPPAATDAPLARRRLGGMGVHLTRVLTDAITHRILPSGGNELTLVKRVDASRGGLRDGDPG